MAEFVISGTPFARALAVGPGVPADRVAALRKAFDELMKDPAFLADAKKRKLNIDPSDAAKVQAMVQEARLRFAGADHAGEDGDRAD